MVSERTFAGDWVMPGRDGVIDTLLIYGANNASSVARHDRMRYDAIRSHSTAASMRGKKRRERKRGCDGGGGDDGGPVNVIIMLLQTSVDGNTTTSVLSFMATKADAGRHLSCQAENRIMGTAPIEDGWVLQIQCKLINDARASTPTPGEKHAADARSFLIYSDARQSGRF